MLNWFFKVGIKKISMNYTRENSIYNYPCNLNSLK